MDKLKNPYLLFGIFDFHNDLVGTSDNDPAVRKTIDAAIKGKKAQWSHDALKNAAKASAASRNQELAKDAQKRLETREERRKAWDEARRIVEKSFRDELRIFAIKGYVLDGEIEKTAEIVQKKLGVSIPASEARALVPKETQIRKDETPQQHELSKPKGWSRFHTHESALAANGYSSLYDLLGGENPHSVGGREVGGRHVSKLKGTSTAQWRAWAEEDRKKLPSKASAEVSDHKKLYQLCAEVFKTDASRKEYDEYVSYQSIQKLFEEVKLACSVTHRLDMSLGDQYARRIVEIASRYGSKLTLAEATGYLSGYCTQVGIAYAAASHDDPHEQTLEFCPWCGALVSHDIAFCTSCGGRLTMPCPQCGTINRADTKFCTNCSYNYGQLAQASSLCDEAQRLLEALRFSEASALLDDAGRLWKDLPGISDARNDLASRRKTFGPDLERLKQAVSDHRMIEARKLYGLLKSRAKGYQDIQTEELISSGIETAEMFMSQAGEGAQKRSSLAHAWQACRDYPGLLSAMATYRLDSVTNLAASVSPDGRRVVLRWSAKPGETGTYTVVRKKYSRPIGPSDGDILAENIPATDFRDDALEPNVPYYYAVVSQLGPRCSDVVAIGPVSVLFDVCGVKLTSDDSSIRIAWSGVPANAEVEAWRSSDHAPVRPGDGTMVANVVLEGLQDSGLTNGITYYYTIFLRYHDRDTGKTFYSRGVSVSGISSAPPEPVTYLFPQLQPDGSFVMEWDQPEQGEVRFYYSAQKPSFPKESIVPVRDMNERCMPLQVMVTRPGMGVFALPDDGIYHVFAATVNGNSAIMGARTVVTRKQAVVIRNIVPTGANAFVMFDWPADCEHVVLVWRTDRYPMSAEERGCARQIVNRNLYDMHKGILVEGLNPGALYYFALYAQFGSGDAMSYSAGSMATFGFTKSQKIRYRVDSKSFLGKLHSAKLVLSANCVIPACELRVMSYAAPVFRNQGIVAVSVPPQNAPGGAEFEIPPRILERGLQYKLFFVNEADYDRIDLEREPGASPEIGR
ncbi:hypothetical protein PSRA_1640 [Pseudoscardovia radai]|uniref:Fibronectin type-III domain-containing protein n=2 Tax=Pseudoscardovia radai TaxID=987066 RepID=A0A261ERB7_9BIFI|nr:hypothetical protein PSRA_1640 [Pseudoscardovia radai]